MRTLSIVVVAVTAFVAARPTNASADVCSFFPSYPAMSRWKQGVTQIPLYLSDYGAPNGAPSESEINRNFTAALAGLYEAHNANINVFYAGRISAGGSRLMTKPGAIVVHYYDQATGYAVPSNSENDYTEGIDQCRIWLEPGASGTTLLAHEVLHCLGIHHPEDCGWEYPSHVSNAQGYSSAEFRRYEIEALETLYGTRQHTAYAFQMASNGGNWSSVTPNFYQRYARGRLTACNAYRRGGDLFSFSYVFIDWIVAGSLDGGQAWRVPPGVGLMQPGVACKDEDENMVAWVDQPELDDQPALAAAISSPTGSGSMILTQGQHVTDHVSATYDPATDSYLLAYTRSGVPRVKVVGSQTSHALQASDGADILGTPAIACGNPAVVGEENCLVAWVRGAWGLGVDWAVGHVSGSSFAYGASTPAVFPLAGFQYLNARSSPALAYTGSPDHPWLLGFSTGGGVSVYRKSATAPEWTWATTHFVGFDETAGAPAISSRFDMTCSLWCIFWPKYNIYFNTSSNL